MVQLNAKEIMELLPHRYPFLFLDRIKELVPLKYGIGIKNVTLNESFFQGHFPDQPILPGIIIVEALAQLTAIVYASVALENNKRNLSMIKERIAEKIGYLIKVDIKFTRLVHPGDQLFLFAEIGRKFGKIMQVKVKAMVDNQIVAHGFLFVSER